MTYPKQAKRFAAWAGTLVLGLALGFGVAQLGPASAGQQVTTAARTSGATLDEAIPQGSFVQVAESVQPAVVYIQTEMQVERRGVPDVFSFDEFFRYFDERRRPDNMPEDEPDPSIQTSQGSGVIVSPDGYILTNAHVVSRIDVDRRNEQVETIKAERVKVFLENDDEYSAEIVGVDIGTDIAVLKIDAAELPHLRFGDSDQTRVGEWVLAVGAPFGLTNTVSAGIISAKGRASLQGINTQYQDFLQTDAAINPGNSGGPLVNLRGEIIGINTAIATSGLQQQFSGVGFATPVNLASRVMDQLIRYGRVVRGWLGVSIEPLSPELAQGFGVDDLGVRGAVVIASVNPGEPADKAGLEPGDIVVAMNGEQLHSSQDFLQRIANVPPGETVNVTVLRDRERMSFDVTLEERPSEEEIVARNLGGLPYSGPRREEPQPRTSDSARLGLQLQDLTPRLARELGYQDADGGVVVTQVRPNSAAARAGLQRGDLVLSVSREPVSDVDDVEERLSELGPGDVTVLRIRRGGGYAFLALTVPQE